MAYVLLLVSWKDGRWSIDSSRMWGRFLLQLVDSTIDGGVCYGRSRSREKHVGRFGFRRRLCRPIARVWCCNFGVGRDSKICPLCEIAHAAGRTRLVLFWHGGIHGLASTAGKLADIMEQPHCNVLEIDIDYLLRFSCLQFSSLMKPDIDMFNAAVVWELLVFILDNSFISTHLPPSHRLPLPK